jgi:hypothetical protein
MTDHPRPCPACSGPYADADTRAHAADFVSVTQDADGRWVVRCAYCGKGNSYATDDKDFAIRQWNWPQYDWMRLVDWPEGDEEEVGQRVGAVFRDGLHVSLGFAKDGDALDVDGVSLSMRGLEDASQQLSLREELIYVADRYVLGPKDDRRIPPEDRAFVLKFATHLESIAAEMRARVAGVRDSTKAEDESSKGAEES